MFLYRSGKLAKLKGPGSISTALGLKTQIYSYILADKYYLYSYVLKNDFNVAEKRATFRWKKSAKSVFLCYVCNSRDRNIIFCKINENVVRHGISMNEYIDIK